MTEICVLAGAVDFGRSSAFCDDLPGFAVAERWDCPDGRDTLYQAARSGVIENFEDCPEQPVAPPTGVKVAIEADDADLLHKRVMQPGLELVDPVGERPWGHRNFEIRDPSELHLVFFTPIRNIEQSAPPR